MWPTTSATRHCASGVEAADIGAESRNPSCARTCSIRCLPASPRFRASGRSWRSSIAGCSAATGRARHRPPVPSAHRRDRPPGAAETARRRARHRRHGRGHRRPAPAAAAAPAARALSGLCQRRDRRPHPDVLQRAQGLPRKAAAGRRAPLRVRHDRALRRHAADGASRPRGRRGRSRQAAAGRAGLSADRRAQPQPGAQGGRCRACARCRPCRNGRTRAGSRASAFRLSPTRCESLHRPAEPADVLPEGPAWSRLAYDELLAGQLALALVRAHLRRPAGRATPGTGALAQEADRGAALLAHAVADARGRRHRRRSRQARAHAAAAARRRRLGQDRGGAARRRDRDRRRPAGGADGADRDPGAAAFQHHRAARRRGRHRRRDPDRPRARPRAHRHPRTARPRRHPHPGRHPCAVPGGGRIPRPRARGRRRAASLRRAPAARARARKAKPSTCW